MRWPDSCLLQVLLLVLVAGAARAAPAEGYVGSNACYGCHSTIYKSFKKTDMGRSMRPANEWDTTSLPSAASVSQPGTQREFRVFHDASGWRQGESEPGLFSVEHQLEYAVGSGANGLTFLLRRGDWLFQAPLSYYSNTRKWDFSPGYEQVDLGFTRAVPEECISCHAGRSNTLPDQHGAFGSPPFAELAIGCENCHGPGGRHVQSAGKTASSVVNPGKLTPRLAEDICMNCHQTGSTRVLQPGKHYGDFRPGESLFDTVAILKQPTAATDQGTDLLEHFSAMRASRCFRESSGRLSCLTCHDPHTQPNRLEAVSVFRAKCLTCHTEQSCTIPAKVRQVKDPPDDCAGCHMPKRKVAQVEHSALTNHRILAREGEAVPPVAEAQTNGLVIVDAPPGRDVRLSRTTLLRAYGELSSHSVEYQAHYSALLDELRRDEAQNPVVQQALGHKAFIEDKPDEAIDHLKRALALNEPSVYLEMAQAQSKAGRHQEAIEYLKTGAGLDPFNPVIEKTLIVEYIQMKDYAKAQERLRRYVETFPEDSFMRDMLARVSR